MIPRNPLCVLAVAVLSALGTVCGQTLGDISGIVTDTSGAVIAGANVTLTSAGTGSTREVKTNEVGAYTFPALTPGLYTLRVAAPGFRASVRSGVQLEVQQSLRLDFELSVGEVTETIEVAASAVQLTTQDSTVGTVIENKRIVDLPLNGRNALAFTRAWMERADAPTTVLTYGGGRDAMYALLTAAALGRRVPEDFGVVQFGGEEDISGLRIDTVMLPFREIGRRSAAMLLRRLGDQAPEPAEAVPAELRFGTTTVARSGG